RFEPEQLDLAADARVELAHHGGDAPLAADLGLVVDARIARRDARNADDARERLDELVAQPVDRGENLLGDDGVSDSSHGATSPGAKRSGEISSRWKPPVSNWTSGRLDAPSVRSSVPNTASAYSSGGGTGWKARSP